MMAVRNPGERFGAVWADAHAERRWRQRTGQHCSNLLVAWGEAIPVETPQAPQEHADARAHVPTDTLLIARWSKITTVLSIAESPDHAEATIRRQL